MANSPETLQRGEPETLQRGQLGLFGVIMPGLAQVAPAFNLFFTTGVMVALAGASAPGSATLTPPPGRGTRVGLAPQSLRALNGW